MTLPNLPRIPRPIRQSMPLAIVAALAAVPLFVDDYTVLIAATGGTYLITAMGLNLLKGYCGPISVGHGALMAVGGYTASLLMVDRGWSFWLAAPVAVVLAAVVGGIIAVPSFRISAWYFAMITLTFAGVVETLLGQMTGLTHGYLGVVGIPMPAIGSYVFDRHDLYWLILGVNVVGFLLIRNIVASRVGRAMVALRDTPAVAQTTGASKGRLVVAAFMISGAYAGIGGVLFAVLKLVITPDDFNVGLSIVLVVYVVLGGLGHLWGPLIGVAVFYFLPQQLQALASNRMLVLGVGLLFVSVVAPKGIAGAASAWLSSRRAASRATPAQSSEPVEDRGGWPQHAAAADPSADGSAPTRTRRRSGVEVASLTKRFGGLVALDDASVRVPAGQTCAIIGPNGSGKTTLLNLICGVYRPDTGQVTLDGQDITGKSISSVARLGVARTFQTPAVLGDLNVMENVLVGAYSRESSTAVGAALSSPGSRRERRLLVEEAQEWLSYVGLADSADRVAASLPHAELRLVEIARGLMMDPAVLLLDEPAAGLSLTELERLMGVLTGVRQQGITVVLVEHHIDVVREIATQAIVLDQGRVLAAGSPAEVLAKPEVIEAYLGTSV